MTPQQVRAMSAPEYMAFLRHMDAEIRERNREAKKAAGKRGRRR